MLGEGGIGVEVDADEVEDASVGVEELGEDVEHLRFGQAGIATDLRGAAVGPPPRFLVVLARVVAHFPKEVGEVERQSEDVAIKRFANTRGFEGRILVDQLNCVIHGIRRIGELLLLDQTISWRQRGENRSLVRTFEGARL